jgi:hypothetical protein
MPVDEPRMDESFWREKAEEARLVAEKLTTREAKGDLLAIAQRYALLAERARERELQKV